MGRRYRQTWSKWTERFRGLQGYERLTTFHPPREIPLCLLTDRQRVESRQRYSNQRIVWRADEMRDQIPKAMDGANVNWNNSFSNNICSCLILFAFTGLCVFMTTQVLYRVVNKNNFDSLLEIWLVYFSVNVRIFFTNLCYRPKSAIFGVCKYNVLDREESINVQFVYVGWIA